MEIGERFFINVELALPVKLYGAGSQPWFFNDTETRLFPGTFWAFCWEEITVNSHDVKSLFLKKMKI